MILGRLVGHPSGEWTAEGNLDAGLKGLLNDDSSGHED